MRAAPDDLDPAAVRTALRERWGLEIGALDYLPVGFGGHHWLATAGGGGRWFVTVDDLRSRVRAAEDTLDTCFVRLTGAYATAAGLADELAFVVGPRPARDGAVSHRLTAQYSLVVHTYLDDARTTGSERGDPATARSIVELLGRLHTTAVLGAPLDGFTVPNRSQLLEDLPWHGGPYAARARALVEQHAADVAVLVAYYETVAARLAARPDQFAVTHGEPHGDNVLRTADGLVLVDWDTALLAPPERDLWMLAEDFDDIPGLYREMTGRTVDLEAVAFYRLWFDLDEIGGYSRLFRGPHEDDANTAVAWGGLVEHLQPRERWPALFA